MKRRTFFKATAISSTALAISGVAACPEQKVKKEKPDNSTFVLNEIKIRDF